MFSTVLTEVEGLLDKRFLLNSFFPVLVFVAGANLLVADAHGGISEQVESWTKYSGVVQVLIISGVLAGVVVAAAILSSCSLLITQTYEGAHLPAWIAVGWTECQRDRRKAPRGHKELVYPTAEPVMPTRLGNALRAAEEYPERLYGARAGVVWPRLFVTLPAEFVTAMTGPADTLQFLLTISLLTSTFGVGGAAYVAVEGMGGWLFVALALGGILVARLAYLAAVETAIDYGLYIRTAFDLHRNEVLAQLRRAAPASKDEEQRLWHDLSNSLRLGEPKPVRYVSPPEK